jgi:hypothetical protein
LKEKLFILTLWIRGVNHAFPSLKNLKKIESYFDQNDIIRLYISIDNPEDIEKCINILKDNSIKGYFATLHPRKGPDNKLFSDELVSIFMTDENGNIEITIPKYSMVNKKGKIVVKEAKRPSSEIALQQQLEEFNK